MEVETTEQLEKSNIFNFLVENDEICFKSQQRNENDLTREEKIEIASNLYDSNKVNFLLRFGQYLHLPHLDFLRDDENPDLNIIINDLSATLKSKKRVKNRRFQAMKELITDGTYFTENEMMKRNPVLYEEMVGQYLTVEEKKERDRIVTDDQPTLVKLLMEGIERDDAEIKRKMHTEVEEDDDSDDEDLAQHKSTSYTQWGEYHDEQPKKYQTKLKKITNEEQEILKEEFVSQMYQSFLDGQDDDFNYNEVDENAKYDDVDMTTYDEEEKYFDSEEPDDAEELQKKPDIDEEEDELDAYMSSINQALVVQDLTQDMKNLGKNSCKK